jgi:hypothetical protein
MLKDARRRLHIDFAVRLSSFELIKALHEGTLGTCGRNESLLVRDASNEYNLLGSTTRWTIRLLRANIDLGISANGRDASQLEVLLEATELQKMMKRRSHVSTKRIFRVPVALREGEVGRFFLGIRD